MPISVAYRHYQRILSRWPKDILRPTISFQEAMRREIDRRFIGPPKAEPDKIPGQATQSSAMPTKIDEEKEMTQANALYSLLENRYMQKWKIDPSYYEPKSNPAYYANLVHELEQAPNRSWLSRKLNSFKGWIRLT